MVDIKASQRALKRLQDKGVTVKTVKPAERPVPVSEPPKKVAKKKAKKKTSAAPAAENQNTSSPKKKWKFEVERDWDGYIKTVVATEI